MQTAIDVIDFWIGAAANDPAEAKARGKLWYQSTPQADEDLRHRFGDTLAAAERGELDSWTDSASGSLALVILLDQFSRNLYRGTGKAFANDTAALATAKQVIDSEADKTLPWIGRAFLYHPFEHSESLDEQRRSVALFTQLVEDAPSPWKPQMQGFLDYAIEHCGVIEKFGRFPHRNSVLGRKTTQQEQDYLDGGASRYGQ